MRPFDRRSMLKYDVECQVRVVERVVSRLPELPEQGYDSSIGKIGEAFDKFVLAVADIVVPPAPRRHRAR